MIHFVLQNIIQNESKLFSQKQSRRKKARGELLRTLSLRRKRHRDLVPILLNKILCENERKFWLEPGRTKCYFWETTVSTWIGTDYDRLWLQNFRVSSSTFEFICVIKLHARLAKRDTKLRKSIPVPKRIAICIWHLATGEDLRSLGWRFDVGKSTACMIVNEVCQAIVDILLPLHIRWPEDQRLQEVIQGFKSKWNFPQCRGY